MGDTGHGNDLGGQVGLVGACEHVASHNVGVLLCTRPASLDGVARGRDQHVGVTLRVGCEGWPFIGDSGLALVARPVLANRRSAPCLHPAHQHHGSLVGHQQTHGQGHRIQTGTALCVDRIRGAVFGQAGRQRDHARGIAARPQGIAQHHGVDHFRAHACSRQQTVHDRCRDFMGSQLGERATEGYHGAARPADDQCSGCSHVHASFCAS